MGHYGGSFRCSCMGTKSLSALRKTRDGQMKCSCGGFGGLMSDSHPSPEVKKRWSGLNLQNASLSEGALVGLAPNELPGQDTITQIQPIRQMVGARSQWQIPAWLENGGWVENQEEAIEGEVMHCGGSIGTNTQPPWSSRGSLFLCQHKDTSHVLSWQRRCRVFVWVWEAG